MTVVPPAPSPASAPAAWPRPAHMARSAPATDRDGYARPTAGVDCFAIALEHGRPGELVACRFIAERDGD